MACCSDEGSTSVSKQQSVQYKLAALYVEDALAGHLDNGKAQTSLAPLWVQRCFAVQTSQSFESALLFASLAHMQLAWWEPASSFNPVGEYTDWPAIGAEVVIVLLFLLDVGLKATYMGLRRYLSKNWHRQYLMLALLYVLDLLLLAGDVGRPLRFLRGLTLLLRERSLRNLTNAIVAASKVIAGTILLMLFLMLTYSAVGARVFARAYYEQALPSDQQDIAGAFNTTLDGLSSVFQLVTTENYPRISWPAYQRYGGSINLYFISFWYVAAFIVLAIVTAVIVDKFWRVSKHQIQKETSKERQGLMRAFALLDSNGSGYISMKVWEGFLQHLMPSANPTEARVRFAMLDTDGDSRIDAVDFLQIRGQLDIKLTSLAPTRPRRTMLRRSSIMGLGEYFFDGIRMTHGYLRWLKHLDIACVLGQALLLCLVWPDQSDDLLNQLCNASLVLAAVSAAICFERLLLMRSAFFLHWSNLSDATVNLTILPLYVWIYTTDDSGPAGGSASEWAFIPELLVALRLFWLLPASQRFLPLLLRLAPILLSLSVVILWFLSALAVLGMEFFSTAAVADAENYPKLCEGKTSYFADFNCAMLTNIQVLVTNDWQALLYFVKTAHRPSGGTVGSFLPTAYFFLGYFLLQIVLYPVLIALATNAYMQFSADLLERSRRGSLTERRELTQTQRENSQKVVNVRVSTGGRPSDQHRFSIASAEGGGGCGGGGGYNSSEDEATPPSGASSRRVFPITTPCDGSNNFEESGASAPAPDDRFSTAHDARQEAPEVSSGQKLAIQPSERRTNSCESIASSTTSAASAESSRGSPASRTRPAAAAAGAGAPPARRRSCIRRLGSTISRGSTQNMTNPDGSSCYYVQMRKNCHYRMGDWRRELMADDLASIDRKELEALSHEARLTQDQLVSLWMDKSGVMGVGANPDDRVSKWSRAVKQVRLAAESARESTFHAGGSRPGSRFNLDKSKSSSGDEAEGEGSCKERSGKGASRSATPSATPKKTKFAAVRRFSSVAGVFGKGGLAAVFNRGASTKSAVSESHAPGELDVGDDDDEEGGACAEHRSEGTGSGPRKDSPGRGPVLLARSPHVHPDNNSRESVGFGALRSHLTRGATQQELASNPHLAKAAQETEEAVRDMHRRVRAKGVVHFDDMHRWKGRGASALEHGMLIFVGSDSRQRLSDASKEGEAARFSGGSREGGSATDVVKRHGSEEMIAEESPRASAEYSVAQPSVG